MTPEENLRLVQDAVDRGDYRFSGQMGRDKLKAAQDAVAAAKVTATPPGPVGPGRSMQNLTQSMPGLTQLTAPAPNPSDLTGAPVAQTPLAQSPGTQPKSSRIPYRVPLRVGLVSSSAPSQTPSKGSSDQSLKRGRRFGGSFGLDTGAGLNIPE